MCDQRKNKTITPYYQTFLWELLVTEWTYKEKKSWKEEEFSLLKRIYFAKYCNFNSVKLIFPSTPHMVFIWAVIYPHEKTGRQMSFKVPNNSLESSVTI